MACTGGEMRCIVNTADVTLGAGGNPDLSNYALDILGYQAQQEIIYQNDLNLASLIETGLAIVQLGFYYDGLNDAIDLRDEHIQYQMDFMQELRDLRDAQDLPMLQAKQSVLTALEVPDADVCGFAGDYLGESMNDGDGVVEAAENQAEQSCAGIPAGWGVHDGRLAGAMAGPYAGGIMGQHSKRREEDFRKYKTRLVRAGQQGMKAVYKADDILTQYAQATSIHAGLADLYIQGFNSAGAALGVALGKLGGTPGTGSAETTGSSGFNHVRPNSETSYGSRLDR